jgi:hypothetical protein
LENYCGCCEGDFMVREEVIVEKERKRRQRERERELL